MTNKSLLFIIILIFLSLILVGCNVTSDTPTPDPDETEEVAETPEVDETQEVVNIIDPLPSNNGEYYVAPTYATLVDEGEINVGQAPGGFYWVSATVTLANLEGETVLVAPNDIYLIGDDGRRYPSYEMVERVAPALVGSELAEGDSVYGFALFALPPNIKPSLFEWCPGSDCETPLQAEISLQNE